MYVVSDSGRQPTGQADFKRTGGEESAYGGRVMNAIDVVTCMSKEEKKMCVYIALSNLCS